MSTKHKVGLSGLFVFGLVVLGVILLTGNNIAVLNPKGVIADQQRELMIVASILMLVNILPVFAMTFFIAYRYREGNTKAKYRPDFDHSRLAETAWWGIPSLIIGVLAVMIWQSSHSLDPYKALAADRKTPVNVEVVALNWKWLFIYPDKDIATVNYLQVPIDTPINFKITSDAPMNSFWIPQLGGMVYAMAGMETKLHLQADEAGSYRGSSANISGKGFAGMKFVTKATSQTDFDSWVQNVKQKRNNFDRQAYTELARPSENNPPASFASTEAGTFQRVLDKYMMPGPGSQAEQEADFQDVQRETDSQ